MRTGVKVGLALVLLGFAAGVIGIFAGGALFVLGGVLVAIGALWLLAVRVGGGRPPINEPLVGAVGEASVDDIDPFDLDSSLTVVDVDAAEILREGRRSDAVIAHLLMTQRRRSDFPAACESGDEADPVAFITLDVEPAGEVPFRVVNAFVVPAAKLRQLELGQRIQVAYVRSEPRPVAAIDWSSVGRPTMGWPTSSQ
jgi:hypothetical protein